MCTRWVRAESRRSIAAASSASTGLPRISPSRSTVVSAVITSASSVDGRRACDFSTREAADVGDRASRRGAASRRCRARDGERDAELLEQLAPARRGRAEDDHRVIRRRAPSRASSSGTVVVVEVVEVAARAARPGSGRWCGRGGCARRRARSRSTGRARRGDRRARRATRPWPNLPRISPPTG